MNERLVNREAMQALKALLLTTFPHEIEQVILSMTLT